MCSATILPPKNIDELERQTLEHFASNGNVSESVLEKRKILAGHIEKFHKDSGTMTHEVRDCIRILESKNECIFLMSGHQPNFLAYAGVMRKCTLLRSLSERCSGKTKIPAIEFFGIADQDFAGAWPWVRKTMLPSIGMKDGQMHLCHDIPDDCSSRLLKSIPSPSIKDLSRWQGELRKWIDDSSRAIERNGRNISPELMETIEKNFNDFVRLMDASLERSCTLSDFSAFVISKIANERFGYPTLFARFSECQQAFSDEFAELLANASEYSSCIDSACEYESGMAGKAPFWYHCDCSGKVALDMSGCNNRIMLTGKCPCCEKEHKWSISKQSIGSDMENSKMMPRISARASAMPAVFFKGLGVNSYVGGALAITAYLVHSKELCSRMQTQFPPIAVWRPHDSYAGLGQVHAALEMQKILSGKVPEEKLDELEHKAYKMQQRLDYLELKKKTISSKEELLEVSKMQTHIKKDGQLRKIRKDISTIKNARNALGLIPSIADYAINIGLAETSRQWLSALESTKDMNSQIHMDSSLWSAKEWMIMTKS